MTTEISPEITAAARLVGNWMKEQGVEQWELMGICSRNHAEIARKLTPLTDVEVESHQFESHSNQLSYMTSFARQLERELAALKRGEFICVSCGLRKDGEKDDPEF